MADRPEAELLAGISKWIDTSPAYVGLDPEAHNWRRISKMVEEAGEVFEAYFGALGENPRKGVTHRQADVIRELLDVAVAALGAVEHLTGNKGHSMNMLEAKVRAVALRAGVSRG